ncbi:Glycosyl transferase, family 31 [Dillenia turbinata]|uniref:Hexosyltransferase n=1 Tax=Dillenia turbinata TaxID=194707 RepID=A0AAN8V9Y6_9MAGN
MPTNMKNKNNGGNWKVSSSSLVIILCISSFAFGTLFTNRIWAPFETNQQIMSHRRTEQELRVISEDSGLVKQEREILGGVVKIQHAIQSLQKTISTLEKEVAAARSSQHVTSLQKGMNSPIFGKSRKKAFAVIGINTSFSSRRRRDSIRMTWMPQGEKLLQLEKEKGIIVRFMIGHSATSNSILDKAIDSEDAQHKDFLRLSLHRMNVKYHEPEYLRFGDEGNHYFRHATGQIYAISKDLATYIYLNQNILHKYANEDVSLGAWFLGLEIKQIDEHCELKAAAGNVCVASFDWSCSGICKSVEKIKDVHAKCRESDDAIWSAVF